jgi:probable F420-dependent oxidoreductase
MSTLGVSGILAGGVRDTAASAADGEAAGFHTAWTAEFLDRSAIVNLAAMANATQRIRVGSSIAYAVGRTPLVLANEARALDDLSGGRLVLGLGTGTKRMQAAWHGVPDPEGPATRMEELVPLLRRLWKLHEGPVKHEGRFYKVDITPTADIEPPVREAVPVFTAGVNPRMVQTAGRVSDGLLGHPIFTRTYIDEVVRPAIAQGAEKAGRDPADVELVGIMLCSIHPDEEVARREVAAQIAFYSAPKTYAKVFEVGGFTKEADAIRDAFARSDHEGMIAAVSDDMIDAIACAGTPEQVRDQLARRDGEVDHWALYAPSFTLDLERVRENMRTIVATCGPQA